MSAQIAVLRATIEDRFPDAVPIVHRIARPVGTPFEELNRALPRGGFPPGTLSVCRSGGGMTTILRATCESAIRAGERAAWIDGAGTITGAFWSNDALLVRPRDVVHALRATHELLRSGGFRLVVLTGAEPHSTEMVRLVRAAHDGGSALVALTAVTAMASLRLTARILADGSQWRRDPFGNPAGLSGVRVRIEASATGWHRRAELSLPVHHHAIRLSLEPGLADRRGLRRTRRVP